MLWFIYFHEWVSTVLNPHNTLQVISVTIPSEQSLAMVLTTKINVKIKQTNTKNLNYNSTISTYMNIILTNKTLTHVIKPCNTN